LVTLFSVLRQCFLGDLWSDSFSYEGLEFKYRMAGTDPQKGSKTTVIPTEIIPLRFVFPDGQVFNAGTDIVDGQMPIQGIINSPIFQNYPFVLGGTDVGKTQYGDAFQRANFWDSISTRAKNYHVILGQPAVLPSQTIIVPSGMGWYFHDPFLNVDIPVVNRDFLVAQEQSIHSSLGISPRSLPITIWGRVFPESSSMPGYPGAVAWHAAEAVNGGLVTYIGTSYANASDGGFPDVYPLSHEVAEWMDDPFTDNYTPGWNVPFIAPDDRCNSGSIVRGRLEVADPIEFFDEAVVTLSGSAYDYHVTEAMFIDFYTRSPRSRSVNNQYSMFTIGATFGLPSVPSSECVGSVQASEHFIDVPSSLETWARGLNNRAEVVGYYLDQQPRIRGFIWKKGSFDAIDFPGALLTLPSGINDWGAVVGYFIDGTGYPHGFAYINGQWQRIDFPGSADTVALGINSAGDIVGAYDVTQPIHHGFILRNGQFTRMDTPFAQQSELYGINDAGQYVGSTWNDPFNGPYLGFIGGRSSFSPLNMPSALFTFPNELNSSGMISGNFDNGDGYSSGFVRLFGYLHEVNADGFPTYAYGNNDRNQICGAGFDFNTRRWVGYIGDLPIANQGDK
jgi:probable HAF family extracellular repeat protein